MGPSHQPHNKASDAVRTLSPLLGDREFVEAVRNDPGDRFNADFVREDRRRLIGLPVAEGLPQYLEQVLAWFDVASSPPSFSIEEVVAVRGERCALVRCRVSLGQHSSESLSAFRNDALDRTERSVLFDVEDVDAAVAELDRMHAGVGM